MCWFASFQNFSSHGKTRVSQEFSQETKGHEGTNIFDIHHKIARVHSHLLVTTVFDSWSGSVSSSSTLRTLRLFPRKPAKKHRIWPRRRPPSGVRQVGLAQIYFTFQLVLFFGAWLIWAFNLDFLGMKVVWCETKKFRIDDAFHLFFVPPTAFGQTNSSGWPTPNAKSQTTAAGSGSWDFS